ncbi:DNA repair metallo-beta-lactamase [Phytophthora cactorum]|nr:DNA repair metallo-beta-lactamase [Phytophthora cactorum]
MEGSTARAKQAAALAPAFQLSRPIRWLHLKPRPITFWRLTKSCSDGAAALPRVLHGHGAVESGRSRDAFKRVSGCGCGEQRCECPTCGQELSQCDERQRTEHVNRCLDRVEAVGDGDQSNDRRRRKRRRGRNGAAAYASGRVDADAGGGRGFRRGQRERVQLCVQNLRLRHVGDRPDASHPPREALRPEVRREAWRHGEVEQTETIVRRLDKMEAAPDAFSIMMKSSAGKEEPQLLLLVRLRALAVTHPDPIIFVVAESSNVFDVLMRGSKTAAVLNARKRPVPFKFTRKAIQRRRLLYPDFKCIQGTNPPFIVDGFQYACKKNSSIYFLTHFHSDHYGGLSKNFDCGIIYCNEITAKLVVQELGVQSKYVHPVGMNTPVLVADVQVTFMDANHCPGSAIILFRLKDGKTYLHTGDFRFNRTMLDYHALQPHIPTGDETIDHNGKIVGLKRLDGVYLDTTYCDPKYTFPTQQVAVDHALELMDKHLKQEKVLYLFGSYTIGKERLFMEIARKFQKKVCVSKAKLNIIETFGWPAEAMRLLTTEPAATNLHVVRMQDLQMDNLTVLLAKHRLRFRRIVAFRPTGWTFNGKNPRSISTCCTDPSGKIHVYGIPYSEHSSFAELCDFVQVVNPVSIFPTVNCSNKRKATNQVNALRQVAFHNISVLFKQQQKQIKQQLKDLKQKQNQNQINEAHDTAVDNAAGDPDEYSSPHELQSHTGGGYCT